MRPIWKMIYSDDKIEFYSNETGRLVRTEGLNLSESDVSVTYTRYINNYKQSTTDAQPNDKPIDVAVRDGLTPG